MKRRLRKKLDRILLPTTAGATAKDLDDMDVAPDLATVQEAHLDDDQWVDIDQPDLTAKAIEAVELPAETHKQKRLVADQAALDLYAKWRELLPCLVEPLLLYTSDSIRKPVQEAGASLKGLCSQNLGYCATKESSIVCLYYDRE